MSVLLETKDLRRYYGKQRTGYREGMLVKAVDGVSITIEEGKSLALIGESGSGKTTFGKLISGLEPPDSGKIIFQGREIQNLSGKEMRNVRRDMQIIFQSSSGVFDPKYTIGESITEVLKNFLKLPPQRYRNIVIEVLEKVGLDASYSERYVHNLSGGECQRANIARALALHPKLVICDEPVSSLDYSIRKQILNLLKNMQEEFGVTYLLITHDLSNVPYVCQQVAIMYQGMMVEYLSRTDCIEKMAKHPYTKLLFLSIPAKSPEERKLITDGKTQALTKSFKEGCCFQNRCGQCTEKCRVQVPRLKKVGEGHYSACHYC